MEGVRGMFVNVARREDARFLFVTSVGVSWQLCDIEFPNVLLKSGLACEHVSLLVYDSQISLLAETVN